MQSLVLGKARLLEHPQHPKTREKGHLWTEPKPRFSLQSKSQTLLDHTLFIPALLATGAAAASSPASRGRAPPAAPLPTVATLFLLLRLLQGSSVPFLLRVLSAPPLPPIPHMRMVLNLPDVTSLPGSQEQLPSLMPHVSPEPLGPTSQPAPQPISLRSLFYSSSMHSSHLFLISSASIRYLSFLSFIVTIFQ